MNILNRISSPEDVKALPVDQLEELCSEIRDYLIDRVSKNGGHLSSNLGIVELTVALHRVFDTSVDRLVFDVGHQSYVHKLITGRREQFCTLRQLNGLSGFPKPKESIHDAFIAGHASNSISVALGMARSRSILNQDYNVIALIGDGALSGGMAYEALNDAGESGERLIVILNDNGMSIAPSVGGMAKQLARQRVKPAYYSFKKNYRKFMYKTAVGRKVYRFTHNLKTAVKNMILHCSMFEEMGFQYVGPVDGHNLEQLTYFLNSAKNMSGPVLVHVVTQKGRGYSFSEKDPGIYHGVGKFNSKIGLDTKHGMTFSDVFGSTLTELAQNDGRVCAITAAMRSGVGLNQFAVAYPERFFDVGIAEEHAVAMAAGMAKQGLVPVFAVYSTFLQRSFDMLIHDVALQNLHVVFAVDRAGIVGEDGETHQGVFDIAFLSEVPNMQVLCPSNYRELKEMLRAAVEEMTGPVAIRYPKGTQGAYDGLSAEPTECIRNGKDVTLVGYGIMINELLGAANILEQHGVCAEVIKINRTAPLDCTPIVKSVQKTGLLLTAEEAAAANSVGMQISSEFELAGVDTKGICLINLKDGIVQHGKPDQLRAIYGLDAAAIAEKAMNMVNEVRI